MKKICYDLKIYDNDEILGALQEDIEALPQCKRILSAK